MKDKRLKYIFFFSATLLLILMIFTSHDAGITCDEVLHYNQSVAVFDYFSTHGENQAALNTPVSNLKYYGQSYDNIVTFLIKWFNIADIYSFRHIMSSLAGWLTILVTALFAIWLADYRAGILTLILFSVSPTFIGHTQNNLKDIPFALGYIATIFYTFKFLDSGRKITPGNIILLTLSIAFSISIRAGGLLLICYLFFFFFLYYLIVYLIDNNFNFIAIRMKLFWIAMVTIASWLLGILLWPFALQSPVRNVIESYRIMAHFPSTFRQIFEGRVEWSDFMPWYYLPKSMAITIPLIVLSGLLLFCLFWPKIQKGKRVFYSFVVFTILFPLFFVVYKKSNLYSSWRQFLFVYPGIVLLASMGFLYLYEFIENRYLKWTLIALLVVLSIHPLKFMIKNQPYSYLYYNQLVGGLNGAYANYETDYYYVSQTEASAWLIEYLNEKDISCAVKVCATYSVIWQFRNNPEIETSYFRYEERSQSDWDFAIVTNRYLSPYQLNNKFFPPENAIHTVLVENVPVCAVIERKSKDDYYGYVAMTEGRNKEAIDHFEKVLKIDDRDEMIFLNFAAALNNDGQYQKADSVLNKGLEINPYFEPILMYLGNIARSQDKKDDAIRYYERVIEANRKYFEAYVGLSGLLAENDVLKARTLLRKCLTMSPGYKTAIIALADTYRKSNPDIAKKYDELANTFK